MKLIISFFLPDKEKYDEYKTKQEKERNEKEKKDRESRKKRKHSRSPSHRKLLSAYFL